MGKITPITSYRAAKYDGGIDLPKSNPWIVPEWPYKAKEQCKQETLNSYKRIPEFLYWVGYQGGMSSSEGYSIYTGRFNIGEFEVSQQLTYVHSMIYLPGTWELYGFKYSISFIEWVQNRGIVNAGYIDDINEYANEIITYNKMLKGSEEDKTLAIALMINNIKGL